MKRLLLTAVTCILLFSCSQAQKKTERKNEPDIYNVESDNKKMNDAITLANTTIKRFYTALTSGDTTHFITLVLKCGLTRPMEENIFGWSTSI